MVSQGCRVLVIDDVEIITRLLNKFLSGRGYRVQTVNDSRKSMEVAREFRPEIVLLDISMPYVSGYEVARGIRVEAGLQNIPIIAITAFDHEEHLRQAQLAGIDHQLTKPCNFVHLDSLLQKCCQSGRP